MRHAQTDADPKVGVSVECIGRHMFECYGTGGRACASPPALRRLEWFFAAAEIPAFAAGSGDFAAALAFATVLGFAALVAGVAATLAFAAIHAFAVMFVHGGGIRCAGPCPGIGTATRNGHGSRDQSCHRGRDD